MIHSLGDINFSKAWPWAGLGRVAHTQIFSDKPRKNWPHSLISIIAFLYSGFENAKTR